MDKIPIIAFSAYSGAGKTTLIEKLVIYLKGRGVRTAVIKHDAHDFDIDLPGKDSWRFAKAGADMVVLGSSRKTAVIEQRGHSLRDIIAMIHDVDLILVEGYNNENIPKIGISRKAAGKGFRDHPGEYIAVVTDEPPDGISCPSFPLDDAESVGEFILNACGL